MEIQEALEAYYGKFNEDKRLVSRHGQVEFITSMKMIHRVLEKKTDATILDVGAGTGRYAIALADEGYDVSAIELVKSNLGTLKAKSPKVKAWLGNALDLSRFKDQSFDLVLMFGPLYHLFDFNEKCQAMLEAKRVLKPDGVLMAAHCMNDYSILMYGFKEGKIKACLEAGSVSENFKCCSTPQNLYDYVRLEDIEALRQAVKMKRLFQYSSDGAAYFMRQELRTMDEETFQLFLKYHWSVCERKELLGAGAHVVDVLVREDR